MSAHTPGPWEARGIAVHRSTPDADTGATPCLCAVVGDGTSVAEDEANACLMAAAPDLLTALKQMLSANPGSDDREAACHRQGRGRAMRTALAWAMVVAVAIPWALVGTLVTAAWKRRKARVARGPL